MIAGRTPQLMLAAAMVAVLAWTGAPHAGADAPSSPGGADGTRTAESDDPESSEVTRPDPVIIDIADPPRGAGIGRALRDYTVPGVSTAALTTAPVCDDGSSGKRSDAIYVRGSQEPDTIAATADVIREAMVFSDTLLADISPGGEFPLRLALSGAPSCFVDVS